MLSTHEQMSSPVARCAMIFNDWNKAPLHKTVEYWVSPKKEAATTPELLRRTRTNDPSAFRILQKFGCTDVVEGSCFSSTRVLEFTNKTKLSEVL